MKQCNKCKIEKPLEEFCNRKGEKDGKHRYCKSCLNGDFKKYYHTERKITGKEYYKEYREKNKEYYNNYCNNHYHSNKDLYREWNKEKYNTDLGFKLKHITSTRINDALKTYTTLKKDRTIEYLGCNMEEYTQYLESLFTPEMNWDNYGKDKYWEIDHIRPICSFNLENEEEMYECFHYKNTRPLSRIENREKSGKY